MIIGAELARRTHVSIGAALVLALPALLSRGAGEAPPPHFAEARSLLEAGKAQEALDKAREGLERAPELPAMLDLASRAAQAAGATDEALWYGMLAVQEIAEMPAPGKEEKILGEALQKRVSELDATGGLGPKALTSYASAVLALGKECAGKKLYVNGVDLLTRCRRTPAAVAAEAELAKIYENKKAAEALLDSGLDVPIKAKKKRAPEAIAKEDAKHSTWETAWEIKGKQYTIKTDMGLELAESMSSAMEQMNAFYRKVFHVKEHGGGQTARVTICVYKSREEFDDNEGKDEPIDKNVAGFYRPGANYVATYDPRADERGLASLWETLFHESSHQFTDLISADLIPAWLNEGTASFFEGARLRGNGIVETNLVPDERLEGLVMLQKTGKPKLEDVVTFFEPGSYPGEYYPFGWGLVYFLLNYEDEKSQRVYVQPYQDYTATYKSGGKHDVKGRFVEHFVTKAKQPGVTTFEEFEARWKKWIQELNALHFGGPEAADKLIARARKQAQDKALDAAQESYAWALRKRPGDPVASFELAELFASRKLLDAAIYRYRGAAAALRTMGDLTSALPGAKDKTGKDVLELSEKQLAKLDKALSESKAKADAGFATAAAEAARAYAEKSLPLNALTLLDVALDVYGPSEALAGLRGEIAAASKVDTRRWRRPRVEKDLVEWEAGRAWSGSDGAMSVSAERPVFALWRGEVPEQFAFEARVDVTGLTKEFAFVGLLFGANEETMQCVRVTAKGSCDLCELDKALKRKAPLAAVPKDKLASFTVTADVQGDKVEVFVDGKSAGKPQTYDPEDLRGKIGFIVQGGTATISEVRVRY